MRLKLKYRTAAPRGWRSSGDRTGNKYRKHNAKQPFGPNHRRHLRTVT